MALFKISKGTSQNLPSTLTEGYCWYTYDDSKFYIDYKDDEDNLVRKAINAEDAATLCGMSLEELLQSISWNDLLDRPFGEEPIEPIIWNGVVGDSATFERDGFTFVKVSDSVLIKDQFSNGATFIFNDGANTDITNRYVLDEGIGLHIFMYAYSFREPCEIDDITIPEAGTYFALGSSGRYVQALTFPDVIKTLDEKYLPDTLARVSDIVQADWSETYEDSAAYIRNKPFGDFYTIRRTGDETTTVTGKYTTFTLVSTEVLEYDELRSVALYSGSGGSFPSLTYFSDNAYGTYTGILVVTQDGITCSQVSNNPFPTAGVYLGAETEYAVLQFKKIPEKYIPSKYETTESVQAKIDTATENLASKEYVDSSQVQSDWSVNDPADPAYIKNRPFHTTNPVEVEILNVENLQTYYVGFTYHDTVLCTIMPVIGNTYHVIFDGVEYDAQCTGEIITSSAVCTIGYAYSLDDSTAYPTIEFFEDGSVHIRTKYTDDAVHNIQIVGHHFDVIQLDEKYIAYKPGKVVAGQTFLIDGEEVVAGRNAEVFNDYYYNVATGTYSHAEGLGNIASDEASHAEGAWTVASGPYAHAEGSYTTASHFNTHAEGYGTTASGEKSHAEGENTTASAEMAHAEGRDTIAAGRASHAAGYGTVASGQSEYVFGEYNVYDGTAYGVTVEDNTMKINTTTLYYFSDEYIFDTTTGRFALVNPVGPKVFTNDCIGQYFARDFYDPSQLSSLDQIISATSTANTYNIKQYYRKTMKYSRGKYAHIVGNGTSDAVRSNAHTLDWSGTAWFAGEVKVGGTGQDDATAKTLATTEYVDSKVGGWEILMDVTLDEECVDVIGITLTDEQKEKIANGGDFVCYAECPPPSTQASAGWICGGLWADNMYYFILSGFGQPSGIVPASTDTYTSKIYSNLKDASGDMRVRDMLYTTSGTPQQFTDFMDTTEFITHYRTQPMTVRFKTNGKFAVGTRLICKVR